MPRATIFALAFTLTVCLALASCGGGSQQSPSPLPPTFSLLYSFKGGADGANPSTASMVWDAQGNLYGTTMLGGDVNCTVSLHYGCGTVWRLDTAGSLTVLHTFTGQVFDAGGSGFVLDASGNLYGTGGDGFGRGLVFKIDRNSAYTVLYDFISFSDGILPNGELFRDPTGNLYGTTLQGGGSPDQCPNTQSCGTVFELDPTGLHTILYAFLDGSNGANPDSVIGDGAGNLYGTTWIGGQGCPQLDGCGTIFKLDPSGKMTGLRYFTGGNDGSTPNGSLVLDSSGNLYGTAWAGGDLSCPYNGGAGCGVVFKLDPSGVLTVLHAFHGGSDGNVPVSVVLAADGNLYGTTQSGPNGDTCGTIFKLDTQGNLTNLHNFAGPEGCGPTGALVQDAAGNLCGATELGGYLGNPDVCLKGCGTVFRIKP